MEVSVVIPTLNRLDELKKCIGALEKQDLRSSEFEIIVVDNGSKDGTVEFLKEKAGEGALRFMVQDKPGASAARNRAVRASEARFIAFTDDDCIPDPDWLSSLLAGFPVGGKCAGVGGPIVPQNPDNIISRFWHSRRVWDSMGKGGRTLHIPTMNVLFLRSVLLEVGIFDEDIVGVEDIHLSQKIVRRKYELWCLGKGTVHHKDPTNIGELYKKCYLAGRGSATVAMRLGTATGKKNPFTGLNLARNLVIRKGYGDLFMRGRKTPLLDSLAFELLCRVAIFATHEGFAFEMRKGKSGKTEG